MLPFAPAVVFSYPVGRVCMLLFMHAAERAGSTESG